MKGAIAKAEELAAATPGSFIPGSLPTPPIPQPTGDDRPRLEDTAARWISWLREPERAAPVTGAASF
jgi:hypothetical protein